MSNCIDSLEQFDGWQDGEIEVETLAPVRSASVAPGSFITQWGYLHGLTTVIAPQFGEYNVFGA